MRGRSMEFVGNIVDFGTAPEIRIDNISCIELVSPNVVRVTYSTKHKLPNGEYEYRVALHIDWDKAHWSMLAEI